MKRRDAEVIRSGPEWARAFGDRDCYLQSQFRDSQFYADSSSTGSWSPRPEGKSNQIGHFLDAVKPARIYGEVNDAIARLLGTTPELSATSDLHNVLIDGIVGHEMAGDDQGGLLQTGVGFANNFGGSLTKQFLKAVEFDTKGFEVERDEILARMVFGDSAVSERYYDPARSGNSIQDLRLTLKGYRFALWSLRNPSPPMVAANWLQNNLMVRTTRTSRK